MTKRQKLKRCDRVRLKHALTYGKDGEHVPGGEYGWVCGIEEGLVKVLFDWEIAKYKKLVWVFEEDLEVVDKKPENRFLFRGSKLCEPIQE